jgi:hypothetical protein
VLGRALFWYIYATTEQETSVPQAIRDRATAAFATVGIGDMNMNPVKKIPLIISGDEGAVYIDELPEGGALPHPTTMITKRLPVILVATQIIMGTGIRIDIKLIRCWHFNPKCLASEE